MGKFGTLVLPILIVMNRSGIRVFGFIKETRSYVVNVVLVVILVQFSLIFRIFAYLGVFLGLKWGIRVQILVPLGYFCIYL